jgi:hypothetical protein
MVITLQEKMSLTFWWVIALGITTYLALGIANTLMVILE